MAFEEIVNAFYMDDLMTGADTVEEASELRKQIYGILTSGGFKLRKYVSNSSLFLSDICNSVQTEKVKYMIAENDVVFVLGVVWLLESDLFCIKLNLPEMEVNAK